MKEITLSAVRQAAADTGMTDLEALTAMQAGAAKLGNTDVLEVLCALKSELLGLGS